MYISYLSCWILLHLNSHVNMTRFCGRRDIISLSLALCQRPRSLFANNVTRRRRPHNGASPPVLHQTKLPWCTFLLSAPNTTRLTNDEAPSRNHSRTPFICLGFSTQPLSSSRANVQTQLQSVHQSKHPSWDRNGLPKGIQGGT